MKERSYKTWVVLVNKLLLPIAPYNVPSDREIAVEIKGMDISANEFIRSNKIMNPVAVYLLINKKLYRPIAKLFCRRNESIFLFIYAEDFDN